MAVELKILALGAVLLFIHIFTATRFKTQQYGRKWNVGARDEDLPEPNPMAGRTMKGYGMLPSDVVADDRVLDGWLARAIAFGKTLPAK